MKTTIWGVFLSAVLGLALGWSPVASAAEPTADRAAADAIVGDWLTEAKDATVRIRKQGDRYVGVIIALRQPTGPDGKPTKDAKNPDPRKRERPLIGTAILWNLKATGERSFEDGYVYDPDSGETYSGKAELEGTNALKLHGYVGMAVFGRTETWTRVAP